MVSEALNRLEDRLKNFLFAGNRDAVVLFFLVSSFFILKAWLHTDFLCGEFEEYLKLKFVIPMSQGISFFYPWSGNGGFLYGHPGFMNFLYYCWSRVFGVDLHSTRMFCLSVHTLLIPFFYLTLRKGLGREVAFYSSVAVMLLPLFQVETVLFVVELGSYTLAFTALFFYMRNSIFLYSLFASLAFLYLESALAFAAGVLVYELVWGRKQLFQRPSRLVFLLMPLVTAILFFLIKVSFDAHGAHITQDLVLRRLMNPLLIFTETDFILLGKARWYTLEECLPLVFICVFPLVAAYFFLKKKHLFQENLFFILFFAAFLQLVFGSFFSEAMGGSDFYAGFFVMFLIFFISLKEFPFFHILALLTLSVLGVNTYKEVNFRGHGWFQTSFAEYSRIDEIVLAKKIMESVKGGPFKCSLGGFDYSYLFCSEFFQVKPSNFRIVESLEDSDVLIARPHSEYEQGIIRQHNLKVEKGPYLGRLHGKDTNLYFIQK